MSYNLKNKNVVILAMTFAVMMAMNKAAYSQDAASFLFDDPVADAAAQDTAQKVNNSAVDALLDAGEAVDKAAQNAGDAIDALNGEITEAADAVAETADAVAETADAVATEATDAIDALNGEAAPKTDAIDALNGEAAPKTDAVNDLLGATEEDEDSPFLEEADDTDVDGGEDLAQEQPVVPEGEQKAEPKKKKDGLFGFGDSDEEEAESQNAIPAPRSPFENFGNAILSKVDNDLFNQMSKIEKQTTILNLELKREDVRNKVEALRAARVLARQEAEARRLAEEEKLKDMESERKAKLLAAEEKLRAKEIELEKVRQNKMLNDYMNEMLILNQKWIEKNAILQNRITELEEERKGLIAAFEEKIADVKTKAEEVNKNAVDAVAKYTDSLKVLNSQITQLRRDIVSSETRIQQLRDQASSNPFSQSNLDPNSASTDLSREYAIMDITGQGDEVVAKIVSRDGTTFTIHKGSVLRGGETVLKITERYIAFDKKGIKAYLYPGGTIMEYEPVNTFSDAEKTPETVEKQRSRSSEISREKERTFGKPLESKAKAETNKKAATPEHNKAPKVNSISFSQGMFAK